MTLHQISIFLQNRPGMLAGIFSALGAAGINIRAMSLADTTDFGILRLIVSDVENGRRVLQENGFTIRTTEVMAVEVPDRPGALARVLGWIQKAGINVEYMYSFVQKSDVAAVLIFRFDRPEAAEAVLRENGIAPAAGEGLWQVDHHRIDNR